MKKFDLLLICVIFCMHIKDCFCDVGDDCIVQHSQARGKCKELHSCDQAKQDLRTKGQLPTTCNWIGNDQIVCCASSISNTGPRISGSRSSRKCEKYSKATTQTIGVLPLSEGANVLNLENQKCGHNAVPLILGGLPAAGKEFPHSAILGYTNEDGSIEWGCGGSLISPRFVLTASHCLNTELGQVTRVRLGELNRLSTSDDASPVDFNVEQIIDEPNYTPRTKYNDIGLIKLHKNADLNAYVKPICLPNGNEEFEKAIATGWGKIEWGGVSSETLLKVTLEIFPQNECIQKFDTTLNKRILPKGIVETTQLCAGSRTEIKDTCQGDSGGPLQIYNPNVNCSYIQIGITSFGQGCGFIDVPAIYTRVAPYVPWIESIVWPNDNSP